MKKSKKIISLIIFFISILLLLILYYVKKYVNWTSFDQLLFSIHNAEGTSSDVIIRGIKYVSLYFAIILVVLAIPVFLIKKFVVFSKNRYKLNISIKRFNINIPLYPLNELLLSILFLILALSFIFVEIGVPSYIKSKKSKTDLYDKYYVNPRDTKITFKNEKRNLIFIFVESLEASGLSIEAGGSKEVSITPNLERLAKEYTNFSLTDKVGGFLVPSGAGWTTGAMVAQTSGIPLKTGDLNGNDYKSKHFLSGAYSIGDVLDNNGYKNYMLMGSEAAFGGRKSYFVEHGNYKIEDYEWAKKEKLIPKDYKEWWGFEDLKLFEFAKSELTRISDNNELFNYTILTADTHFTDGYRDSTCKEVFDDDYSNAFYCNDEKINDFVNWIKAQKFYKNTTIVIVGDHPTMQAGFYDNQNYNRTTYNVIINGPETDSSKTKNRVFTSFDIYPTTLASIGATIPGDRLGLGTNLYSDRQTLIEELGHDYFVSELYKDSDYYNQNILKSDYLNMYKEERR